MSLIYNISIKQTIEEVGAKAVNLQRLHNFGYHVPPTYFITVKALHQFLTENGLDEKLLTVRKALKEADSLNKCNIVVKELRDAIFKGTFNPEFLTELKKEIIGKMDNPAIKLAVRSSSINEDLEQHSFAGQYASELNVNLSVVSLERNIKSVWASQWSDAIISYSFKHNLPAPEPGMGIIVQQMVTPEIAGVLFSHNPYSYNKNEMIVEYVDGLGEALVSGEKTPVHLAYNRSLKRFKNLQVDRQNAHIPALKQLVESAKMLEKKVGLAVDLEWAWDGETLWHLQMRSITTVKEKAILWTDENVGEVIPDVVTPFSWSILSPITNNGFKGFLERVAVKSYPEEGLFGLFKGKVYFNSSAFKNTLEKFYLTTYLKPLKEGKGKKLTKLAGLFTLPFKLLMALWKFFKFTRSLPTEITTHFPQHQKELNKNSFKKGQSLKQAYAAIQNLVNLHKQTMYLHISDTILAELYYQFLNKICQTWLKKEEEITADHLLSGLDAAESAKSGYALWEIALFIKENRLEDTFLKTDGEAIEQKLQSSKAGQQVQLKINQFMNQYGHGALHEFELLFPRWWEDSSYIFSNIQNYLSTKTDLTATKAKLKNRRLQLLKKSRSMLFLHKKWFFNYIYKQAVLFSTQRENLKQAFLKTHSQIKHQLMFLADELVRLERLVTSEDILFLKNDELANYIETRPHPSDLKPQVESRRKKRGHYCKEKHPGKIEQIGEVWRPVYEDLELDEKEGLTGIGCSSGTIEGTARVITSEKDFDTLNQGDILITYSTNPGWTPLFVTAAAVVTEIGGALSHGAIIAREYGLPMVAAVNNVTKQISSGDKIYVNGDKGIVRIIKEE